MASSSEAAPVKTVQLEGKIIAITGANRGLYIPLSLLRVGHTNTSQESVSA
jgi:hypothetical protein